jgi:chemotaxis protein MotB
MSQQLPVDLEEPREEGHEEPWLVAYADLMTLLFGFFAMLFTFASFTDDSDQYVRVRKELAKYFGMTHVAQVVKVTDQIEKVLKGSPGLGELALKQTEDGFDVQMMTQSLFESGGAKLSGEADTVLHSLVDVLKDSPAPYSVRVEGHCDDIPAHSPVFPSNWELSAARAGSVVRTLERYGIPADHLSAVGYGSSRPAFPNRDLAGRPIPDNLKLNRRVVIKVTMMQPLGEENRRKAAVPKEAADSIEEAAHIRKAPPPPEGAP